MNAFALDASKTLMPIALVMVGATAALQLFIAVRGGEIDAAAAVATAVVALVYAFLIYGQARASLACIRFGALVAHVIGFVTVNVSFHLHAFVRILAEPGSIGDGGSLPIGTDWFGVLVAMPAFWGLGLLVHVIASVSQRGYEQLP